MEIYLPSIIYPTHITFLKRKEKIINIIITINKTSQLTISISQFLPYKKSSIFNIPPQNYNLLNINFQKLSIEFYLNHNNNLSQKSNHFIIENESGFINYNRILSNCQNLLFLNHRQKLKIINHNNTLYLLKPKYEPKYDFQIILNNLNLLKEKEIIQLKRENNTTAFLIKIEKLQSNNNTNLIFNFNQQNLFKEWTHKLTQNLKLDDEKLILKFHYSNTHIFITINEQISFLLNKTNFKHFDFKNITTSIHEAILMLPEQEQIIFNQNDKIKKPIQFWIDKKQINPNTTLFQIINLNDTSNPINLPNLRKEYQNKLNQKWTEEINNSTIQNFCLFNLNPIKKILYFSRGYGRHRFGWDFVCKEVFLKYFADDPEGILLDPFIEATFLWKIEKNDFHYSTPWIGFIHSAPTTPTWYNSSKNSLFDLITNLNFQKSLPFCQGLIVLSNHLKNHLEEQLKFILNFNIPIYSILHPSGIPTSLFNIKNYEKNSILHIGLHLRNFGSFYLLPTNIKKYMIIPTEINWKDDVYYFIFDEIKKSIPHFNLSIYQFKQEITCYEKHLTNDTLYDQLLSNHIIFCDFYDSSANNLIVECIMSQTPILVNKNPAIVEYLGENYPFFFETLNEASQKATNEELIKETFYYLKTRQELININKFKHDWAKITNSIQLNLQK